MSAEATGWVWRHSPWKGEHAKFLLHLAVADVVNDAHGNEFWMSQANLAEKAGVSREWICKWFGEAIDAGLVELVRSGAESGKANCYRLLMPLGGCDLSSQGGVNPVHRGCESSSHITKERTKEGTKTSLFANEGSEAEEEERGLTEIAQRVLSEWVNAVGKEPGRVKMNAKRLAAVKARLKEGYTEEDLIEAVRGLGQSAWHMGNNPERKRYDDLLLAIRDGERVERFRDLYEAGGDVMPDPSLPSETEAVEQAELLLKYRDEIQFVNGSGYKPVRPEVHDAVKAACEGMRLRPRWRFEFVKQWNAQTGAPS